MKAASAYQGTSSSRGPSGGPKKSPTEGAPVVGIPRSERSQMLGSAILKWTVPLFAIWAAIISAFKRTALFADKAGASAHSIVMLGPMLSLAVRGMKFWFLDHNFTTESTHDKVWGYYAGIVKMLTEMFAFQIWDFFVTLMCPELCKFEHLLHHSSTAVMALVSLFNGPYGFGAYYAPFFAGVSEVSSVPLGLMELFRINEGFAAILPKADLMCRIIFATLFLSIRCLYWPLVVVDLFKSILSEKVPKALTSVAFVGGIFFTFLQLYWGKMIVDEAMKML